MTAIMSLCAICVLLVTGIVIRSCFPVFQRFFIPSSVIAGFAGLIVINTLGHLLSPEWFAAFGKLPGFLINIVFAGDIVIWVILSIWFEKAGNKKEFLNGKEWVKRI